MTINNSAMFRFAHRQVLTHQNKTLTALQRLSSGYRINSAADDAAGLGVSERMRAQITTTRTGIRNAKMQKDMHNTGDSVLGDAHRMANRLVALATQAGSSTLSESQRGSLQKEADELLKELERLTESTRFNNRPILKGEGAFNDAGKVEQSAVTDAMTDAQLTTGQLAGGFGLPDMNTVLDMLNGFSLATVESSNQALAAATKAIDTISSMRGQQGANVNRLEYQIQNMETELENMEDAESRIRDADMAKEMMNFTKEQVLTQAASMVMAHIMNEPYKVLELIKSSV